MHIYELRVLCSSTDIIREIQRKRMRPLGGVG
jgi:hypothetical protein